MCLALFSLCLESVLSILRLILAERFYRHPKISFLFDRVVKSFNFCRFCGEIFMNFGKKNRNFNAFEEKSCIGFLATQTLRTTNKILLVFV